MPNRRFDDPRSPLQWGHDEVASHRVLKTPSLRQLLQFPIKFSTFGFMNVRQTQWGTIKDP